MNIDRTESQLQLMVGPTAPTRDELDRLGRVAIVMSMNGGGQEAAAMLTAAYRADEHALRAEEN